MRKVVISASSLPAGRNMSAQIEYLVRVGSYGADMYHLDVMDGVFTKYKSIDYKYFDQLREKSPLLFDAHLMIKNPYKIVDKYIKAGADIITVNYEAFDDKEDILKTLKKIKSKKKMAGIAIDLDTDVKVVEGYIKYVDLVLIMSVKLGKGGQEFNQSAIKKIKYVRSLSPSILIEVDGGVNDKTAPLCIKAGADILVSGSYIYNNDTYEAIQHLRGKNG
ncbi:MAG: ribulose-phosphate 3-epimerase [Clostridiales bacterium]|nr:ribulose-phosphate 3-epimerase [Clostridiales bacterium]